MRTLIPALLALALAASPAFARVPVAAPVAPKSGEAARLQASEAAALAEAGRSREAFEMMRVTVGSKGFAELPEDAQAAIQFLYGLLALQLEEHQTGLEAMRLATAWKLAPAPMWDGRLQAAAMADNDAEAAFALTHIARMFPEILAETNDRYIFGLVWRSNTLDDTGEANFQLVDALYDADWKPQNPFYDAAALRVPLARHLIARGNLHKAQKVLSQPLSAGDVVSLRVEKAFDPVVQPHLEAYDVLAAGERELARVRKAAADAPRNLEGVNAVADALLELGRYEEALPLLDDAIRRATPLVGKEPEFDDLSDLNWTYNYRAQALAGLGRDDEAIEDLRRGARRPEQGQLNVSQAINMGQHLALMGRADDALAAVADVTRSDVSDYGWLSAQLVRVCAYAQLGDAAKSKMALDDILSNRKEGQIVAQEALLCAGDEAGVAEQLVSRLRDPVERGGALMELQDYLPDPHATAIEQQLEARFLAARARPEVQAAIAEVGRIEKQPLPSPRF